MAERKTKRNARQSKRRGHFQLCSEPIVHFAGDVRSSDSDGSMRLPRVYDRAILFAVARDEDTIFAAWNIDWPTVCQKRMPSDGQVYLRVIGSDGSEQKRVAVEPMLATHYLTTSVLHGPHRVEIGYYQPRGMWHSVAISDELKMPKQGSPAIADVDLATIPFHLGFQQLISLFGATRETPLAKVVSKFQNRALNSRPNELPPAATQILRKLDLSLPEIATARRAFAKSDTAQFARRRPALLQFAGTNASRGFEGHAGS